MRMDEKELERAIFVAKELELEITGKGLHLEFVSEKGIEHSPGFDTISYQNT